MNNEFEQFGLSQKILKAIEEVGYLKPTEIQEKAIPKILAASDILGCAQTGTGKTAAFTLPVIELLISGQSKARMPRCIILEPTRELAAQVAESFDKYGKYVPLSKALLIGGVSFEEQLPLIDRGVDVLIATPGRFLDIVERGRVLLRDVKILVLDEADRMLDMGFLPDIEKICQLLGANRQTAMFSATMPKEIIKLADKFLHNPKQITVSAPSAAASTVKQSVINLSSNHGKYKELCKLLSQKTISNALVFCNRKRDVAQIYDRLLGDGFSVGALHGDMEQYKRMECLEMLRKNEIQIMVCSDVAARGLDVPLVSHVINYDVPIVAEDYVHRIGRTGRAGRSGEAITFKTKKDVNEWNKIIAVIGGDIEEMQITTKKEEPKISNNKKHNNSNSKNKDINNSFEENELPNFLLNPINMR